MLSRLFSTVVSISPGIKRFLWRKWYQILADRYQGTDWIFMNYGYSYSNPEIGSVPLDENDEINRLLIQLYHHVASAADVAGKEVLEVGSGRGGGASYVMRYFIPESLVGMDISEKEVAFCDKVHQVPGLSFQTGDAEELPFDDQFFDVVLNVESSHCYGDIPKFLAEVKRILRPGGAFSFCDLRRKEGMADLRNDLSNSGLKIEREEFITENVIKALDEVSKRKENTIDTYVPRLIRKAFSDFAGVKGSKIYEAFKSGDAMYISCLLRKKE